MEKRYTQIAAVESLRDVLATHFGTSMAEAEVFMRRRLREPKQPGEDLPQDTLVRRQVWKYFEQEFGGWIRSLVREEFKQMADGKKIGEK